MVWQNLGRGILEDFCEVQDAYVTPEHIEAEHVADRNARLQEYRADWRERNPEKHRASVRVAVKAHWLRTVGKTCTKCKRSRSRKFFLPRRAGKRPVALQYYCIDCKRESNRNSMRQRRSVERLAA